MVVRWFLYVILVTTLFACNQSKEDVVYVDDAVKGTLVVLEGSPVEVESLAVEEELVVSLTLLNQGEFPASAFEVTSFEDKVFSFYGEDAVFPGEGGTCGVRLEPGKKCSIRVKVFGSLKGSYHDRFIIDYIDTINKVKLEVPMNVFIGELAFVKPSGASTSSQTIDFGAVEPGTRLEETIEIINSGDLIARNIRLDPETPEQFEFLGNNCPEELQPSETCEFTIQFYEEEDYKQYQGSVKITYDTRSLQKRSNVFVRGKTDRIEAKFEFLEREMFFSTTAVNGSTIREINIRNNGYKKGQILGFENTTNFTVLNPGNCEFIAVEELCTLEVVFKPISAGSIGPEFVKINYDSRRFNQFTEKQAISKEFTGDAVTNSLLLFESTSGVGVIQTPTGDGDDLDVDLGKISVYSVPGYYKEYYFNLTNKGQFAARNIKINYPQADTHYVISTFCLGQSIDIGESFVLNENEGCILSFRLHPFMDAPDDGNGNLVINFDVEYQDGSDEANTYPKVAQLEVKVFKDAKAILAFQEVGTYHDFDLVPSWAPIEIEKTVINVGSAAARDMDFNIGTPLRAAGSCTTPGLELDPYTPYNNETCTLKIQVDYDQNWPRRPEPIRLNSSYYNHPSSTNAEELINPSELIFNADIEVRIPAMLKANTYSHYQSISPIVTSRFGQEDLLVANDINNTIHLGPYFVGETIAREIDINNLGGFRAKDVVYSVVNTDGSTYTAGEFLLRGLVPWSQVDSADCASLVSHTFPEGEEFITCLKSFIYKDDGSFTGPNNKERDFLLKLEYTEDIPEAYESYALEHVEYIKFKVSVNDQVANIEFYTDENDTGAYSFWNPRDPTYEMPTWETSSTVGIYKQKEIRNKNIGGLSSSASGFSFLKWFPLDHNLNTSSGSCGGAHVTKDDHCLFYINFNPVNGSDSGNKIIVFYNNGQVKDVKFVNVAAESLTPARLRITGEPVKLSSDLDSYNGQQVNVYDVDYERVEIDDVVNMFRNIKLENGGETELAWTLNGIQPWPGSSATGQFDYEMVDEDGNLRHDCFDEILQGRTHPDYAPCSLKFKYTPKTVGTWEKQEYLLSYNNGVVEKYLKLVIKAFPIPPRSVHHGWNDIAAIGDQNYLPAHIDGHLSTYPIPGNGVVYFNWLPMTNVNNMVSVVGYNIYRFSKEDFEDDRVDIYESTPINSVPLGASQNFYVDESILPNKAYYYKVAPVVDSSALIDGALPGSLIYPSFTREYYSLVRTFVPPEHHTLIHRFIVNSIVCKRFGIQPDPERAHGCIINGTTYDIRKDIIMDRYEVGINESEQVGSSPDVDPVVSSQNYISDLCTSQEIELSGYQDFFVKNLQSRFDYLIGSEWPDDFDPNDILLMEKDDSQLCNNERNIQMSITPYNNGSCVSRFGLLDAVGNAREWSSDQAVEREGVVSTLNPDNSDFSGLLFMLGDQYSSESGKVNLLDGNCIHPIFGIPMDYASGTSCPSLTIPTGLADISGIGEASQNYIETNSGYGGNDLIFGAIQGGHGEFNGTQLHRRWSSLWFVSEAQMASGRCSFYLPNTR